jgi:dipeptidyl aminopeptidase/acylaminoacyl peptidase
MFKPALIVLVLVLTGVRGAIGATSAPAIFEIRGDGSARRLVGGVGALGFALSKDGSRLAFFRAGSGQRSVWIVNRDGSGERQLVADTSADPILIEFPLAWSPKGDALAYTTASCPEPCTATRVVIVDARDGHRLGEIDRAESLRWAADGRRMVWACDTEPDPYDEVEAVCFTLRKGGPVQRVSARRNFVNRPLPSPDGERVAFTGLGGSPLTVLDLRRRSLRLLADPASSIDGGLAWSPDGRRLAFATAANELFTIATAGGRPRRVGLFRDALSPAWGPGGRRIAFLRSRLWTVRPDGRGARRITRELVSRNCPIDSFTAPSCGPAWSPDGRKLYYLAGRRSWP